MKTIFTNIRLGFTLFYCILIAILFTIGLTIIGIIAIIVGYINLGYQYMVTKKSNMGISI